MTAAVQAHALDDGTLVDHFRITRLLARGAMGEVYLARDTKLGRRVALKLIAPALLTDEAVRERFTSEAKTTARFNHPHIVTIYEVGEHAGRPYVALEYLEGENLAERIDERPPSLKEAIRIATAVASALQNAHANGILHRDLKPENVVLARDGRLRVVDFGLSRQLGERGGSAPNEVGVSDDNRPSGTPAYMAPEQWRDDQVSAATDVWAFGVLLFELISGELPYLERSLAEQARAVCADRPAPRVEQFEEDCPEVLADLVAACLEKDPAVRPSAEELVRTLDGLARGAQAKPVADEVDNPFPGLLPYTHERATVFYGRGAEVASFVERMHHHAILPVVGPSGVGKSSFVLAGVIPRLREQERWVIVQMRPGPRPFRTLAGRLTSLRERLATSGRRVREPKRDLSSPGTPASVFGQDDSAALPPSLFEQALASNAQLEAEGERISDAGSETGHGSDRARASQSGQEREDGDALVDELAPVTRLAEELFREPGRLSLHLRAIADELGCKVLLFVDQLEEAFTLVDDGPIALAAEVQARFMSALCTASDDPHDPVRVVFTVRDDFLGRIATSRDVSLALSQVTVLQNLDEEALVQVLTRPVESLAYRWEDDALPREMVAAVAGEPAGLPLLSFTASMLWERRDRGMRVLTRDAYEVIGGVEGALATHADGVLAAMAPNELSVARELLLRLVTAERTRRIVPRDTALEGLGDGEAVLARLVDARLVSISRRRGAERPRLELVHESLIGTWHTLSRWIDEARDDLAFIREVEQAAALWDKRGRRPAELWRGDALKEAMRMAARLDTEAPVLSREFLTAAHSLERSRERRKRLLLFAVFVGLSSIALVLAFVAREANVQREVAEEQREDARRKRAEALREAARAAMGQGNMLEARAKLRVALTEEDSVSARALWRQLSANPLRWTLETGGSSVEAAFSADGTQVATNCHQRVVCVVDTTTRAMTMLRGHSDPVAAIAFSPDGKLVVSGDYDGNIRLWDLQRRLARGGLHGETGRINGIAISPDGKRVAAAAQSALHVWEIAGGDYRVLRGHSGLVNAVAFHPKSDRLVSAGEDGTAQIWSIDGTQLHVLEGHTRAVEGVAYDASGARIATASIDRRVMLWDGETGRRLDEISDHSQGVRGVSFSADGRLLASASYDSKIRIWRLEDLSLERVLEGHGGSVRRAVFGPDDQMLVSAGYDGTLRLWDLSGPAQNAAVAGHTAAVRKAAFDQTGERVISVGNDRSIRIWSVATGDEEQTLEGHTGAVYAVDHHPTRPLIVSGSLDGTVRIWDREKGAELKNINKHDGSVYAVRFSPRGSLIASGSRDQTIRLWSTEGEPRGILHGHDNLIWKIEFSRDGERLASASMDGTIRLWSVPDEKELGVLSGHAGAVYGVGFTPDGKRLVSGGSDKTVRLWTLPDGRARILGNQGQRVLMLAVHPSGDEAWAPGADGNIRIWSLDGGADRTVRGHFEQANHVAFSRDGALAASTSNDATLRVWHVASGRPLWHAPVLLRDPPLLRSHRGWTPLAASGNATPDGEAHWRWGPKAKAAVAERTRLGSHAAGGSILCLHTHEQTVELWDLLADSRIATHRIDDVRDVIALDDGCLVRADQAVVVQRGAATLFLAGTKSPTAIAHDSALTYVAVGATVVAFDVRGQEVQRWTATGSVSSIAPLPGDVLAVGYEDGSLELLSNDAGHEHLAFEDVPASRAVRLLRGPANTIVGGFASGTVAMWSLRDGKRLADARLHGPVVHLLVEGRRLFAATDLGHHLTWDLTAFHQDYCELLREVWSRVPVVWSEGRPVLASPPSEHPCIDGTP